MAQGGAGNVHRVAVIMAGGSGERFWPLSRLSKPKQLLKLTSRTETLLEESVRRILPLIPETHVYIATTTLLRDAIVAAQVGVPKENVLAEPAKRNTAGCLSWVAAQLRAIYGPNDDVAIAVLTADHLIGKPEQFRDRVNAALEAAEEQPALVTIGVRPTRPETGYGYLEVEANSTETGSAQRVLRFREKPNRDQAIEFLCKGNFFWNSGMFFWRLSTFQNQMATASPIHAEVIASMAEALRCSDKETAAREFERLPDISIDYALLERASKVLMVAGNFPWDDVGSWDALERSRDLDAAGNVIEGDAVVIDARGNIVVNSNRPGEVAVGVVGVEDLIVIVSNDAVLVSSKAQAQEVRLIARELRRRGASQI